MPSVRPCDSTASTAPPVSCCRWSQIHVAAAETRRDPGILGIHIEGPFLSSKYCGAHDPALLRDPDPDLVKRLLDAADGTLRQVTMAPERVHFVESAQILREAGVVVAAGHTAATFEQAELPGQVVPVVSPSE